MKNTAITALALAALALPLPAPAQDADARERRDVRTVHRSVEDPAVRVQQGRQEQTERITRTLNIGSSGELDLTNIAGDIVVRQAGGSEARIEIVKTANARTVEDARQMLGLVQVEVSERNNRGEVRTRYPSRNERGSERRNINVSVAYNVSAPPGTRLTTRSISGSIKVEGIKGDLSLETVSGDVDISNAARVTAAKSISGNVAVSDSTLDGSADIGTISGTATVRGVQARRLSLNSISGNIIIDNVTAERIDGQAMSGDVQFASSLAPNGRYELKSHSGDVRVTVSGNTGFELEANSWSGSVRADIAGLEQRSADTSGRTRRRELRGTYGNGSAILIITTFSGDAIVTKR